MTQVLSGPPHQKRGKMLRSKKHRYWVKSHLCVACERGEIHRIDEPNYDACHINYLGAKHDRPRGKGERVDDIWTVPMCRIHHEAQTINGHSGANEEGWWWARNVDPEPICIQLALASPDPKVVEFAKQYVEVSDDEVL